MTRHAAAPIAAKRWQRGHHAGLPHERQIVAVGIARLAHHLAELVAAEGGAVTPNDQSDNADDIEGGINDPVGGMGAWPTCPFQQAQARSRHTGGVTVALASRLPNRSCQTPTT